MESESDRRDLKSVLIESLMIAAMAALVLVQAVLLIDRVRDMPSVARAQNEASR